MLHVNDVVKVSKDIQDNIKAGDLGTVVGVVEQNSPVYEIEFTDNEGRTIATVPLNREDMSLYWVASTETYSE